MFKTSIYKVGLCLFVASVLIFTTASHVKAETLAVPNDSLHATQNSQQINQKNLSEQIQEQINEITAIMVTSIPNGYDSVQVFDVKQGHVIKSVENSKKIQKQTKHILKDIYEYAPEVQPDMNAKYIIRIPVNAGTQIKLNNNTITIQELFIFYYENKQPLLLVFDENKRPSLFHTKHEIEPLLKLIQVQ